jgi:hypothetical protein
MLKRLGTIFAMLIFSLSAQAVCPIPQYEQCRAENGTDQYLNCLARNRQEDARFQQCQDQERRERERERQEQERREQEKYCRQNPDAPDCR